MIFNSQVICNVYPIICRMQILSVFFYYYSFDLHACIWIDNPIQFLTGTQNSCSNPIFSNFFCFMYSKPCSNSSNIEYSYLNMFSNLMSHILSSPNQFCLKHQHFIIYSIQIFIFFFIVFLFISDHCCSRAVQILIFQTSVQNYSIIATAFKILGNWKLWTFFYMNETWTCINILFT